MVGQILATVQDGIRTASELGRSYRKLVGAPDLPVIKQLEAVPGPLDEPEERFDKFHKET